MITSPQMTNTWFHAVMSFSPDPEFSVYINGTLAGSKTTISSPDNPNNTTGHLMVGRKQLDSDSDSDYCSVVVDEVMLWNRVLTDAEILALYETYCAFQLQ